MPFGGCCTDRHQRVARPQFPQAAKNASSTRAELSAAMLKKVLVWI